MDTLPGELLSHHIFPLCFVDGEKDASMTAVLSLVSKRWKSLLYQENWASPVKHNRSYWAYLGQDGNLQLLKWYRSHLGYPLNRFAERISYGAARGGHLAILEWLLDQKIAYFLGVDLCTSAAYAGHLNMLIWMRERAHFRGYSSVRCGSGAAMGAHRNILEWMLTNGEKLSSECCAGAAQGGHLELLQYLRTVHRCDWDVSTTTCAAKGGHLEVLKFARENGCRWNSAEVCRIAAKRNDLEMLRWCKESENARWESDMLHSIVKHRRLDAMRYVVLSSNSPPPTPMQKTLILACITNQPEMVLLLMKIANVPELPPQYIRWAVRTGCIDLCYTLHHKGMVMLAEDMVTAAEAGHPHVMEWLNKEFQIEVSASCVDAAALNGRVSVLKYLREKGYNLSSQRDLCFMLATGGHVEGLAWARAIGCEWDSTVCAAAARKGHLSVLKYLRSNECEWDSETLIQAALEGHINVLKWCIANGCGPVDRNLWHKVSMSRSPSRPEVLEYLISIRCPGYSK